MSRTRPLPLPVHLLDAAAAADDLLARINATRREVLRREATAQASGRECPRGVRADTSDDLLAWLRDEVPGDYLLPAIGPLWMEAAGLGRGTPPAFAGEPPSGPDTIQVLDSLAAWLLTAAGAAGRLALDPDTSAVTLDGRSVLLDGTPERRAQMLCYLGYLLREAGNWISDGDIDRAEREKGGKGLDGARWDRVRARLPSCLRALIETDRRKGSRLLPAAWRK